MRCYERNRAGEAFSLHAGTAVGNEQHVGSITIAAQ